MTAKPDRNPFRPGVGARPLFIAGRERELRRFKLALRAAPEIPANIRLTGLRGVGKTVLLAEYALAAEQENWIPLSLEMEPRHNTEATLTTALSNCVRSSRLELSARARLKSRMGQAITAVTKLEFSYHEFKLRYDSADQFGESDLSRELYDLADQATKTGYYGAVLLLDEAQVLRDGKDRGGEYPLSLLLAVFASLQKAEIPVTLVLCGLPTLTRNLLKARTYTERMFRGEEIGSLSLEEAREAFVEPLRETSLDADPALVDAVLEEVDGYPYFIQLWGAELWEAGCELGLDRLPRQLLEAANPEIYRRLDIDFYEPRVDSLTQAEQDLLLDSGQCDYPPLSVADLSDKSPKNNANVNVLLGRLVEAGVMYRVRQGQYEYTAPRFYEYLQRRDRTGHRA